MSESDQSEINLCIHLFATSSAMVGVCLTVIGILRIVTTLKPLQMIGDDLLAIDSLLFLVTTFCAYGALKSKTRRRRINFERVADIVFLFAMSVMAFICFLVVYVLTTA